MCRLIPVLTLLGFLSQAWGQLPDFYKEVDRLTWVVEDLSTATQGWRKLGFAIAERGEVELPDVLFRGRPVGATVRVASGLLGDVPVDWVQPVGGRNAYTEFLDKHGSGVFSLLHRVPSAADYDEELARMGKLGVGILQQGTITGDTGVIRYAYLDTEPEGKYVLGLFYVPGSIENTPLAVPGQSSPRRRITQYAFAVEDLQPVSQFWSKLGFPEMEVTHPELWDLRYHDQPGEFDAKLGWHRHGRVVYEWILPLKGPSVYLDHLKEHGEGVHHIAFGVEDMDQAIAEWTSLGFAFTQGGAWGEKGQPGWGRFAYHDTDAIGGSQIELLWNYR